MEKKADSLNCESIRRPKVNSESLMQDSATIRKNLAYWHATDEPQSKDHLYYIIWHESKEAAATAWKGFIADPDWKAAAAASGVGRLAKPPISVYMKSTDYSKIK